MGKKLVPPPVKWLSDKIVWEECHDPNFTYKSVDFYTKFKFNNIEASVGEFILISNADAAEPDTEEGCDCAQLVTLYESHDMDLQDRYRARVKWFAKPTDIPKSCKNVEFSEKELIEDHRPYDVDVSIETFFRKCNVILTYTSEEVFETLQRNYSDEYTYVCRYRLIAITKRKFELEPVMEDERRRLELLKTPASKTNTPKAKTPSSITKRLDRMSISDNKWNISNSDGTKLLLKRAIFADKKEKMDYNTKTPEKILHRKLETKDITGILSMELEEKSEDELPTLIIRQTSKLNASIKSTPRSNTKPKRLSNNSDDEIFQIKPELTTPKKLKTDDDQIFDTPTRRSVRSTRKSVMYKEDSDLDKTPRSNRKYSQSESERTPVRTKGRASVRKRLDSSDDEFVTKTPVKPKLSLSTNTPSKRVSRKVTGLTPSLQSRLHSVENVCDIMLENKTSLPGREQQMDEILSYVRNKILDNTSGCMYISGVPGTGKTATVCRALEILKDESLPDFQLVEVNGMGIAEPRQAYVQIYKQLTGKSIAWEQASSLLEKRFTTTAPRRTPTVLLVDELDALCTRRQDVLYSIMEWTTHTTARLCVLAVANTMDLPERVLASRVASRLGLTRLTFPPYTHTQLQTIVTQRLVNTNLTADAVQLIARKVAAVSGDARRALTLCTRAMEIGGPNGAGLKEVEQALSEAASGASVRAIKCSAPAHKLMLRAIAAEVERTGLEETTLSRALQTAAALVSVEARGYRSAKSITAPPPSVALAICAQLASHRLLLMETKGTDPKLLLNVSVDDVRYATRQIY